MDSLPDINGTHLLHLPLVLISTILKDKEICTIMEETLIWSGVVARHL